MRPSAVARACDGPSAAARTDLGSCRLYVWEVAPWENGKYPWEVATWEST